MKDKRPLTIALSLEILVFLLVFFFMRLEGLISSFALIVFATVAIIQITRNKSLIGCLERAVTHKKILIGVGLILILALPLFFHKNNYIIHILTLALIYVIAALGLNFQVGSLNIVNFAQCAFFGIGAYTSAIMAVNFNLPFWVSFPSAIIVSGAFGFLLGIPTLKTKEFHLSLVTIAFAYIAYLLVLNLRWVGGADGIAGIPKPDILGLSFPQTFNAFGIRFTSTFFYYYFVLAFLFLAIFMAWRIHNSWLGLGWNAIREDEISARCYGIPINRIKILAFVLGSMFAGISGSLYAHFVGFISSESMAFSVGLLMVCMVILGGMDNIFGVIIGASLLIIIPEKFRAFNDFRLLSYGVILILMLLFRPQGLLPKGIRKYRISGEVDSA